MLAGTAAISNLVVTYVDKQSFISMMDKILLSLGITSPDARAVAIGQAGVETSYGTAGSSLASMSNNFWNVQAGSSWTGPTIDGTDKHADGSTFIQHWRVYASPIDAAKDWINLVATNYPDAWVYLQQGDAESYARALWARGYYEENPDTYVSMLVPVVNDTRGYLS
jgi:flagellum-specific peptidoglycan hydrolase FlgJ